MRATLHYIFDPLCGWCYGAGPLLARLSERFGDQLALALHPGLLFPQPHEIAPAYRAHIVSADQHIAVQTGVEFGAPYIERVRSVALLHYHSAPPAAAVMAAQALQPALSLRMLEAIQHSHYVRGADVGDSAILSGLAQNLGMTPDAFEQAMNRAVQSLPGLAEEAHSLLLAVRGNGFPTLVLERGGKYLRLDHGSFYGQPDALADRVAELIEAC